MNQIIIIFKTFVVTFIFYIFGYLLRLFYCQIPNGLFIALFVILLIILMFFVYKNRKDAIKEGETNEDMPAYLQRSVYFFLIIGCCIGYSLSSSEFRATLIIDNGYNCPVEVSLSNGEKHTVLQDSFIYTSIPTGHNLIIINGDSIKIDVLSEGRWIYNIDNLNKYLITNVDYSNPNTLYLNGKNENLNDGKPSIDIISETFFEVKTDFIFKAPKTITYSERTNKRDYVRKTILLRISPSSENNLHNSIIETY